LVGIADRHLGSATMKPIMILGIVLILAGVGGLVFRSVHWTETKNVVDAGPIQINSQEDHSVWIPTAAGIAAVLAGMGLVFAGRKST
jgi:hypothetical protein